MVTKDNQIINIYTDGACSGNQFKNNTGGWGAILEYRGKIKEIYGGDINTTNNRMELTALIEGLCALKKKGQYIQVFSDSSYLIECLRKRWYEKWRLNGWTTAGKKPVEHRDLWEQLLQILPDHDFHFFLIKGHIAKGAYEETRRKAYEHFVKHNGDKFSYEEFLVFCEMNSRADELANIGVDEARA